MNHLTPPHDPGGEACAELEESDQCEPPVCASDCKVSQWSEWNIESNIRRRSRVIVQPPDNGGQSCPSLVQVGYLGAVR